MKDLIKPAIVAIGYNRPKSLLRLLKSIGNAVYRYDDIILIISIDFGEKENLCYKIADEFVWKAGEKIVIKHNKNLGLRKHVLSCGDFSQKYGAVILLEDDIVVSEEFYNYAFAACNFFGNREEIVGIGLYSNFYGWTQYPFYPVKNGYDNYYGKWVISWGECFCADQWKKFRDWYELNKEKVLNYTEDIPSQITEWPETSWGKYMYYYMNDTNKFFAMPYEAYTTNYAEIGKHIKNITSNWQTVMQRGGRNFVFADMKNAVKYDMFMENMDVKRFKEILDINGKICIDLSGRKTPTKNYDYFLSTQKLPFKILKSFALRVRPIEENIFYNINGEGIFLYDIREPQTVTKKEQRRQKYELQKYYYPTLQYREVLNYMVFETTKRIQRFFKAKK